MTQKVTKPIALDESFNTTEETPRNIADVLAEGLNDIANAAGVEGEMPLKKVNGKLTNNGNLLTVTGNNAWAEGERTRATAGRAHAEGYMSEASGADSHSEGSNTIASGDQSHAEGAGCTASGKASHAGGMGTRMSAQGGTAIGKFNSDDTALVVVGDGTDNGNRSDAFKVDSTGRTHIKNEDGNLVKLRGAGIATFTVTQTGANTYVYPSESDVRTAISNYDTVILRLAKLGGGFANYILDRQSVAAGIGTEYTWVREDGSRVITLEGSGSPVVWTWGESSSSSFAKQNTIAPQWKDSEASNYKFNSLTYNNSILYRCKVGTPSAPFNVTEWNVVDIASVIDELQDNKWYSLTPTTSESNGYRITSAGSVEVAAGYQLNRYYVAGLGGRTIRISSDYNSVFSTTDSASQRITTGLASGDYIIPASAVYLIVSHTTNSNFSVGLLDSENSASSERTKTRIAPYDSSSGYKINSSGSVVSDADWSLIRFHTDSLINAEIEIDAGGYSVFSTSSSVGDRVTSALEAGTYQVPNSGTYLIISVETGSNYNVWLLNGESNVGKYGTYGLQMRWSDNTTYRLGDATNKSFAIDNATGLVTSDFDTCYPWCDMRLCNIENPDGLRTITYQGEAGFTFTKDTFVEIPKFYFKRVFDPNTEFEYWYISDKPGNGFELEPWFRNADGSEASVRYVARYNLATSGNISRTGNAAYWNESKSTLKTYCESNDFKLMDINAYQALIHLFVIESGTKDSQSVFNGVSYFRYFTEQTNQQMTNASATTNTIVIPTTDVRNTYFGVGDRVAIFQTASNDFSDAIIRTLTAVTYAGSSASLTFDGAAIALTQGVSRIYGISQLSGRTDSISATSGRTTDGDSHTRSFSYRGIENLWGNLGELVDGVTYDYDNHRFKIGSEYVTFETPINRSYIEDASTPKWIQYFGVDARFKSLTLPTGPLTTSNATSYKDEWSTFGNESGISDISYGCAWDHQNANGVMCFRNVRDTGNILYTGRAML